MATFEHVTQEDHDREVAELREMIHDLFNQACQIKWNKDTQRPEYDHMCISAYENAQRELIKWGLVDERDCGRL